MNGQALLKEFGGLSAKAMFKKLDWLLPIRPPPTPPVAHKKGLRSSRTDELVEKWKNKSLPKNPYKKKHPEKPTNDDENDDLFLEKPSEKRKKN